MMMIKFFGKTLFTVALFFILTVLLCSCGSKQINMKDFIEITYESYNGYASAYLDVDYDSLNSQVNNKKINKFVNQCIREDEDLAFFGEVSPEEELFTLADFLDFELAESYNNLSNGDKVVVCVSYSGYISEDITLEKMCKGLGIKIKSTEIEYKVKGLKEPELQKANVEELVKVSFSKYNGYAQPTVEIDAEKFRELFDQKIFSIYKTQSNSKLSSLLNKISNPAEMFEIVYDQAYNNLSNDDKVTFSLEIKPEFAEAGVTFDTIKEKLYVEFKDRKVTSKVSGLEEAKNAINLFEDVEAWIKYEGANGYGKTSSYNHMRIPEDYVKVIDDLYFKYYGANSLKVIHNNKNIATIYYDFSAEGLSQGDIFEITARSSNFGAIEDLGYIIPTTRTQVAVPDLGTYMTSPKELSKDMIEKLIEKAVADSDAVEWCKLYCATIKPGYELDHSSGTAISAIVKRTGWFSGGYCLYTAYDIIIKGDEVTAKFKAITTGKDSIEKVEDSFSEKWEFNLMKTNVTE